MKGTPVLTGNAQLLRDAGITVPDETPAGTVIHLGFGGTYAGCIRFSDAVKPHAKDAVAGIKKLGVHHISMLTGDADAAVFEIIILGEASLHMTANNIAENGATS